MEYPRSVCVALSGGGTIPVGTSIVQAFKVASDATGGGITVVSAGVASGEAIAAGSIPLVRLVYSNSGGTVIGTLGASSTAVFTANIPKVISLTQTFLDADYYVGFQIEGTAATGLMNHLTAFVNYVPGY